MRLQDITAIAWKEFVNGFNTCILTFDEWEWLMSHDMRSNCDKDTFDSLLSTYCYYDNKKDSKSILEIALYLFLANVGRGNVMYSVNFNNWKFIMERSDVSWHIRFFFDELSK